MKLKHIRWLFIGLIALLVWMSIKQSEPKTLGISAVWTNGNYRFAGGTEPGALAFSTLFLIVYLLLMHAPLPDVGKVLPGVFRRFVACWLDLFLAIISIAPVVGILATFFEWKRTGIFEWFFERSTPAAGDALLATVGVVLIFAGLIFYHSIPLARRRPSPGACIIGYQVISDQDEPLALRKAMLRTMLGFITLCGWPFAPFIGRDRKKGKIWLDEVFNTRAVLLR